jgi:HK97 family phage portal protein
MSFLNAVKNKLFGAPIEKGWEELRAGITVVGGSEIGSLAPTIQTHQALKKYRSWVYPCVNLIARKVTTVPYYLYKQQHKHSMEDFERVLEHPIIKLLKHPNDFLSGRQLREIIQMHLDLVGFAFVKIVRNAAGQPRQLFPYYPQELIWIELGTTNDNVIKAFHFAPIQNRHKVERIPYQDMLYFHYPHPENPYMPLTPIQAISHITDVDLYLQEYTKGFFINGARPDFVIIPEKQIGKIAADRVAEGWQAKFGGPGKRFKPAVLSENVKIQQLAMNARDFEFLGMSNWVQEHILAAYGVPKAMFGLLGDSNRAASLNAETVFINNCIMRRLHLFEDVINHQLLTQYRNLDGYEFEHANALPRDDEWETTKDQTQLSIGRISLNEIRRRDGEKPWKSPLANIPWVNGAPLPGCDEEADALWSKQQAASMMPAMPEQESAVPPEAENVPAAQGAHGAEGGRPTGTSLSALVQETMRNSRPSLSMLLNAARGKRGGLAALVQAHPETGSLRDLLVTERGDTGLQKLLTRGIRDYLLEEQVDEDEVGMFESTENMITKMIPIEEEFEDRSEKFYIQKGIEIAEIVKKSFSDITTKGPDFDFDETQLKQSYMNETQPFIVKAVEIGYQTGFELVGKQAPDPFETASLAAAGKLLNRSADLKVKSTKTLLTSIIQEGLQEGWDADEVAERITTKFVDIGGQRAMLIARTELAAAAAVGQDAAYEKINSDAGKIVVKETTLWPSLDERLCKECRGLEGDTVKDYITGKEYLELPIHPNCRCSLKPRMADTGD